MGKYKRQQSDANAYVPLVAAFIIILGLVAILFDTRTGSHCKVTIYTVLPPGNPITDVQFFNAFRSWTLATDPPPQVLIFGPDIDKKRQEYLSSIGVTFLPFLVDYKEVVYNTKILKYLRSHAPYNASDVFLFANPYTILRPAETTAAIRAFCSVAAHPHLPRSERCEHTDSQAVMFAPALLGDVPERLSFSGQWEGSLPAWTAAPTPTAGLAAVGEGGGLRTREGARGGELPMSTFSDDAGQAFRYRWGEREAGGIMLPDVHAMTAEGIRGVFVPVNNASWVAFGPCSALFSASTLSYANNISSSFIFAQIPSNAPTLRVSVPALVSVPPQLPDWAARGSVPPYLPWPGGSLTTASPTLSVTLKAGGEISSHRSYLISVLFGRRGWGEGPASVSAVVEPLMDFTMRLSAMRP